MVTTYLRSILLNSEDMNDRTTAVATAIKLMSVSVEDSVLLSVIAVAVYEMTRIFSRYKH